MKIAMPVDGKSMDSVVSISFGRAPYFLFYDTKTKEASFMDNPAATSPGGAGIKAAQMVLDNKADALLVPRCGENAAALIKAAGIGIYKTSGSSVVENIKAFIEEKLPVLNEIHEGFHGN